MCVCVCGMLISQRLFITKFNEKSIVRKIEIKIHVLYYELLQHYVCVCLATPKLMDYCRSALFLEKAMVLDLIRTAISTEEVTLENPMEADRVLSPSPLPHSRAEARIEKRAKSKQEHRHPRMFSNIIVFIVCWLYTP